MTFPKSYLKITWGACIFLLQPHFDWLQNSGDKHFKNINFMNLTFRMLVNIHFQKYNR